MSVSVMIAPSKLKVYRQKRIHFKNPTGLCKNPTSREMSFQTLPFPPYSKAISFVRALVSALPVSLLDADA